MMQTLIKLDQEVERTLAIARTRFPSHSFPDPKVTIDLTGKSAGMFCTKDNVIRFNLNLMLENKEDFIKQTVPHEVAHFVVEIIDRTSLPHGATWQAVMKLFGISNPMTYHNYVVAPPKRQKRPYIYRCSCKEHSFTKIKHKYARSGISYTCHTCHGVCRYIGKKKD